MKVGARAWVGGVLLAGLLAAARVFAQDLAPKLSVDLGDGVKMEFVLIKAGCFMMGSEKGEADEKPLHDVTITKPFYMGVYEVTQAQWMAIMGDNPSYLKGNDLPVESVTWDDAQKFAAKLKTKLAQSLRCRLPTEAEWEYACRAGSKTAYCFGDDETSLAEYAWYQANSGNKPHPVGQKKPNAWGLYDMHGNIWEWCEDWHADGFYAESPREDPKGPSSGRDRVMRGGSWSDNANEARSANRSWYLPTVRFFSNNNGFRVVLAPQDVETVARLNDLIRQTQPKESAAKGGPEAPNANAGGSPGLAKTLSVELGGNIKMDLALIPAGSFMMGSEKDADERPAHKVTITKPFYMGVYEVTQAQWKPLMGENPSSFKGDALPVEGVSWEDCREFLAKLKEKLAKGSTCRLPTEAEWEYACRAGAQTAYGFGDGEGALGEYAWYDRNSKRKTHSVGRKNPNAWGLFDMHGNVWEWCQDWYDDKYYVKSPGEDPEGPSSGDTRVLRGGSWNYNPDSMRCSSRNRRSPSYHHLSNGFRVVVPAQE